MNEILKKREKEEAPKPKKHAVLLELGGDDYERLQAMVGFTETNQADVLRQCLRHVHRSQFGAST